MRRTRIAAITAAGALVAAGGGVAFATTSSDDPRQREQAVLEDAAAQLDVSPSELRDALADAQDDQLDADVKAGRLTQEEADALKERRREAGVVLGGGPPFFGKGLVMPAGPHEAIGAAAKALGITDKQLMERLHDGESLADIAKAEGKDLDAVKDAVRAAVKPALDKAVEHGPLTREQADRMLDRIVEHLGEGPMGFKFRGKGGGPDEIKLHVDGPDHIEFDADGPPPLPIP